jgi:arylsulfatase A-like enzyme
MISTPSASTRHITSLLLIFLASALVMATAALAQADQRPPNFVVIFSDYQGYADVGCFGSPDIRTPRLDAMAKQGMKFTSFYAQPICGPSRAALMTGCYPMRVAERGNIKNVHPILHSKEITVAEVLKKKGYATACFGKWDLAKHAQAGFFMDLFPVNADEKPVYKPFPIKLLPRGAQEFVRSQSQSICCDPSYIAIPMLGAVAATTGTTDHCRVNQ